MSIDLQKQIKDNSNDLASYRSDLFRWSDEQEKAEVRRGRRRPGAGAAGISTPAPKEIRPNENEVVADAAMKAIASAAGTEPKARAKASDQSDTPAEPIKRDGQAMHQYYSTWDQFDVDGELDRLNDEALDQQRVERESKQAEKDRILDELALQPDGDRKRTSKARPRVKVAVRASGRRVAPVDLAEPRRKEANGYFSEGRFKEAVATYTAALDLLEKYEPPEKPAEVDDQVREGSEQPEGQTGDCAGVETEALQLKTTLLANRAAALLKLEEWRHVIADCTEALRFDPKHCKSMLRRGFAYARQKRWGLAARDLALAVAWDPGDRKAAAELQMARRMLEEQAKEARERARTAMCDSTRRPTMPTRRITVRVQRAGSGSSSGAGPDIGTSAAGGSAASRERPEATAPTGAGSGAGGGEEPREEVAPAGSMAGASAPSRPQYVPRSVRMRGRQAAAVGHSSEAIPTGNSDAARGGGSSSAAPRSMNFYAFEAQWSRHRGSSERLGLLRRVGARALPALFRESLDSELVASITEVLSSEVSGGSDGDAAAFATDAMAALARTPRFDMSCQGLSRGERAVCLGLLDRLHECGACDAERLGELRRAYVEPESSAAAANEGSDEDDVEEPCDPPVCMEPALAAAAVAAEASAEAAPSAPAAAAAFSLDGCD